jgi:DNA-binding NarL/FixJ family response regulator
MTTTQLTPSRRAAVAAAREESRAHATHRVVLVDPRDARRAVMSYFVEQFPEMTVVGEAANLEEAAASIASEQANVALVEIQMPLADGLATIGGLRSQFADLRIVVCSFLNDAGTRALALASGADGYLAKPPSARDLLTLVTDPPPVGPDVPTPA